MRRLLAAAAAAAVLFTACDNGGRAPVEDTLTVYSGRSEELVGPLIEQFEDRTGVDVKVRYGDTAALAATILEEDDNSPADVFWAQDAGALGAVAAEERFAELPRALLNRVPARFRSPEGFWVGTSGRARTLAYNAKRVPERDLPASVLGLTDKRWRGRIGWAPTNGSFQAFVTALRKLRGDRAARQWLEGMKRNDTKEYESNAPIVQAVAAGEIDAGLVNHYYVLELGEEDERVANDVFNHFFKRGDPGNLVNVAGVGILDSAPHPQAARRFVDFLLSRTGEQYFDEETIEYPLQKGAKPDARLEPLGSLGAPDIDLSNLEDLEGTLDLMRDVGVL